MPSGNIGYVANGNIAPSRFVKQDTTKDHAVLQAGAGDACIGVSGDSTRYPVYAGLNDGYHAVAGESCKVYQIGQECQVEAGAAVTRGDRLKSDANGKAITASTGDASYAKAIESASGTGVLIMVQLIIDTVGAS